jgi:hypothetical protein
MIKSSDILDMDLTDVTVHPMGDRWAHVTSFLKDKDGKNKMK